MRGGMLHFPMVIQLIDDENCFFHIDFYEATFHMFNNYKKNVKHHCQRCKILDTGTSVIACGYIIFI